MRTVHHAEFQPDYDAGYQEGQSDTATMGTAAAIEKGNAKNPPPLQKFVSMESYYNAAGYMDAIIDHKEAAIDRHTRQARELFEKYSA